MHSYSQKESLWISKPSIAFAHGLLADGFSFNTVIPALQQEGLAVVSTDNPLNSRRAAHPCQRMADGVDVAVLAPDKGETRHGLASTVPAAALFSHPDIQVGRIWIAKDGIKHFAGELPEAEQQVLWATQTAPAAELLTAAKMGKPAWKSRLSSYIVAQQDEAVNPDGERFMAKHMGATTVEAESSHLGMQSDPEIVLDQIRRAAQSIPEAQGEGFKKSLKRVESKAKAS